MALTYKEILRAVRFKERDNDEIKFSDYEIKEATNEAIRYISNSLADTNSDFNERQRFYNQEECGCNFLIDGTPLPDDFLSLVSVSNRHNIEDVMTPCLTSGIPKHNEYKIARNKIFCGCPEFCLIYKCSIPEIESDDDEIELPYFMKDTFVTLVRRIVAGAEEDIMREAQEEAVNQLIPKRRYRNAKIRMPFRIGW